MPNFRLLADDITGALDISAEFVGMFGPLDVVWTAASAKARPGSLAIASGMRGLEAEEAYAVAHNLAPLLHGAVVSRGIQDFESVMLLAHGNMRVSHVSTHVALQDVPSRLTAERLRRVIDLTEALRRIGIARPKIAVAALNPHGGEGGLFGRQDVEVSQPTIARLRQRAQPDRGDRICGAPGRLNA
jgi:Pyridoxal phosphate biosynthetic protein PdxA